MLKVMTKTLGNAVVSPAGALCISPASVGVAIAVIVVPKVIKYVVSYETPSGFKCRVSDWRQLKPGDVIGVHRKPVKGINAYDHYGIYAGNLEVIHFSNGRDDSFSGEVSVRKDSFYRFKGEDKVFAVDFDGFNEYIENLPPLKIGQRVHDRIRKYHFYSPEETLRNAEREIGKKGFKGGKEGWRPWRNCEHFALWCKTGVAESSQIQIANKMLEIVS